MRGGGGRPGARRPGSNPDRDVVLNAGMTRSLRHAATAALVAGGLGLAAPAEAAIIEIGDTATDTPPSCPASPCQAVSRTTGYQVRVGEEEDAFVVPQRGRIVAWTITLGDPTDEQREFFEENLGGPATAGISVLRTDDRNFGRVVGVSSRQPLTPFFGTTVQFPLAKALYVRKGYRVALTVPTWAPALALGLGSDSAWRASRPRTSARTRRARPPRQARTCSPATAASTARPG